MSELIKDGDILGRYIFLSSCDPANVARKVVPSLIVDD